MKYQFNANEQSEGKLAEQFYQFSEAPYFDCTKFNFLSGLKKEPFLISVLHRLKNAGKTMVNYFAKHKP
jgi:hypothetical protein